MLDSNDLILASYIEQEFLLHGDLPSKDNCREKLGTWVTPQLYEGRLRNKEFQEHLHNLGVPIKRIIENLPPGALTIEQLRAINTLLDFNDTRSDKKKLQELGIKSATYQAWKKDPAFQGYISKRALNLLGDNIDEVDRALLDQARSGEISAIKYLYEVTGRYNPKLDNQVNVKELINTVIEIIMQEVKDPEVLQRIATKFQLIVTGNKLAISEPSPLTQRVIESVAEKEEEGIPLRSAGINF